MTGSFAPAIAPGRAILINEASVATGVPARRINRLIDDAVLPGYACAKAGGRRALRAFAVPMVGFGASDGAKLSKNLRLEAMRLIGTFTRENWPRLLKEPAHADALRFESGRVAVALGEPVSEAMAGLNKWLAAQRRVVRDPDIRGGIRTIRGTRIGVYEAAGALAADGMDAVLECFPTLGREDLEAAALYAKVYPMMGRPRKRPLSSIHPNLRAVSETRAPPPVVPR